MPVFSVYDVNFGSLFYSLWSVTGNRFSSSSALNALYLLFGIALICMSFNLVQEEVIKNVKGFAMQLGLIQDPDDEEE